MFLISFLNSFMMGCSGEITMYVTPKIVSGRVVYTLRVFPTPVEKSISAPVERPIQLIC